MTTFAADIRHWPDLDAFARHLWAHDPAICSWATELVYHHTWKPTAAQWRGRASVENLLRYYRDICHWSAGPQLFVAGDGIWQLTPLDRPGIHANAANGRSWGIEVVGNYDLGPWPADIAALAYGAGEHLLRWRGLDVSVASVNGHRKYNPAKTCPGRQISLDVIRTELASRLHDDLTYVHAPRISRDFFAWELARRFSPATPEAGAMYDACAAEHVDPALLLAHFRKESEYGHKGLTPKYDLKNPGAVRTPQVASAGEVVHIPGRGRFARYPTWTAAARDWAIRMRDKYSRTLYLFTVRRALPVYAPSADGNKPVAYAGQVVAWVNGWSQEDR